MLLRPAARLSATRWNNFERKVLELTRCTDAEDATVTRSELTLVVTGPDVY